MLKEAAELGYAPAQALMALLEKEEPSGLAWAEKSVAQLDRNGLARLGEFLTKGVWGRVEKERGRAALLLAAELGQREAMLALWKEDAYPASVRYRWLCRAASMGSHWASVEVVNVTLPAVERGELVGPTLLELGAMLKGRLDSSDTQILGMRDSGSSIRTALQCIAL
jgi:TPR repeat protein